MIYQTISEIDQSEGRGHLIGAPGLVRIHELVAKLRGRAKATKKILR